MAIPNYKDIVDLLKKGATIEAQEKILELREGAMQIQEENLELKSQLQALKEALHKKEQLKFDGDVYWLEDDQTKDGPFCSKCFDNKDTLVRLHEDGPGWFCYTCGLHWGPSNF